MPLSRRYTPEKPTAETSIFGMSFESVIPPGVGIASGVLDIFSNVVPPVDLKDDWTMGPVLVQGRVLYATLSGGKTGTDYILQWTATDTNGNIWPRSGLVLVAETS
jgi:hypothetical protein